VRYRARVEDLEDAGVMLVALALGLAAGAGLFLFASTASVPRRRSPRPGCCGRAASREDAP
jgi:hypothetical protein